MNSGKRIFFVMPIMGSRNMTFLVTILLDSGFKKYDFFVSILLDSGFKKHGTIFLDSQHGSKKYDFPCHDTAGFSTWIEEI